jgi:ATP-dependent DNA ligase
MPRRTYRRKWHWTRFSSGARLEREGDRVRLITKSGYNCTDRYPWIVKAARKIGQQQLLLDAEAVVLSRLLP